MVTRNSKIKSLSLTGAFLLVVACSSAPAQKPTADYVDSVLTEFAALEKRAGGSGQDWFDLAARARESGDLDIAEQALIRAEAQQFSPIRVGIERARINVGADKPDLAVAELQSVFDAGFTSVRVISGDPVLGRLAGQKDYDALIVAMTAQAYPCQNKAGFTDFNFWVGEWDVALANGTPAGSNSIRIAERGCVILENWTSVNGGTGMSINYLDKTTDEWVQVWNAEGGNQINIRGGLTNEGMRLVGHIHYVAAGTTAPFRALFTPLPDGRVRQFFEQSNDEGATWVPWFEGFYTRKPE